MEDFYKLAGSIIYHSQLIEHNLRVIIYLDTRLDQKGRKLRDDEYSAEELLDVIQKETLGTLINTAQEFNVFNKTDLNYLRSVTPKRNAIAHHYFKDAVLEKRMENPAEQRIMLNELIGMERDFIHLHNENLRIITDYEKRGARK